MQKLRDPELNAEYMFKTGIRPLVEEKPKVKKLDQKTLDKHTQKHSKDN